MCNHMFIKFCILVLSIAIILNALSINKINKILKSIQKNDYDSRSNNISKNNLNRLEQILNLLNYNEQIKNYHRSNLIHSIMHFSEVTKDKELKDSCLTKLGLIGENNELNSND